jgi:hypothetical protein
MKAYFFTHSYLSSIQKGIQAAHCLAEMALGCVSYTGYTEHPNKKLLGGFKEWAEDHKTIIILNGGNCAALWDIWHTLCKMQYDLHTEYPQDHFYEDGATLNQAITSVGIIIPEDAPQELLDYIATFQLAV